MDGRAKRWGLALVLMFAVAVAAGCAQHYYNAGDPGPDGLRVNVQYRWASGPMTYRIFASAFVQRPDGSYQRVDNLKIWIKTKDLKDYNENWGQYEIDTNTYRPAAPSDNPTAYACATYKGQTFCGGDRSAQN